MHSRALALWLLLWPCSCGCTRAEDVSEGQPQAAMDRGLSTHSPMPSPNRGRLEDAVRENDACILCHDEQAAEWRGSFHQASDIDPAYRDAFAIEPLPFCRGCHAPEADARFEPPQSVSEMGVGCVTCHVTEEGVVLAGLSTEARSAPHALRRSEEFARTGGCVGCHEFAFPGVPAGSRDDDALFMQTTVREHARSGAANTPCADCHMPVVAGRRSHSFAQVRDPAWLRKNITVNAERGENDSVQVTLHQTKSGHAFPTGDLFRRLEVGAELRTAAGRVLRRDERHLARHFVERLGAGGRELLRDDRVFSNPVTVDMDVAPLSPMEEPLRIFYWVKYQRVATIGDGTRAKDVIIESEVLLHSGEFSW